MKKKKKTVNEMAIQRCLSAYILRLSELNGRVYYPDFGKQWLVDLMNGCKVPSYSQPSDLKKVDTYKLFFRRSDIRTILMPINQKFSEIRESIKNGQIREPKGKPQLFILLFKCCVSKENLGKELLVVELARYKKNEKGANYSGGDYYDFKKNVSLFELACLLELNGISFAVEEHHIENKGKGLFKEEFNLKVPTRLLVSRDILK